MLDFWLFSMESRHNAVIAPDINGNVSGPWKQGMVSFCGIKGIEEVRRSFGPASFPGQNFSHIINPHNLSHDTFKNEGPEEDSTLKYRGDNGVVKNLTHFELHKLEVLFYSRWLSSDALHFQKMDLASWLSLIEYTLIFIVDFDCYKTSLVPVRRTLGITCL